jgi:hypothetical protein
MAAKLIPVLATVAAAVVNNNPNPAVNPALAFLGPSDEDFEEMEGAAQIEDDIEEAAASLLGPLKEKISSTSSKRGGVKGPRTINDDHEDRYKNALGRYWDPANVKANTKDQRIFSLKKVAAGEDKFGEETPENKELLATIAVNFNTLKGHKKKVMQIVKKGLADGEQPKDAQLLAALEGYAIKPLGNEHMQNQDFFSQEDYDAITAFIVEMQERGFPLSIEQVSFFINDIASAMIAKNPEIEVNKPSFDAQWITHTFLKKKANQKIKLSGLKSSHIDPKRASQASPEVGAEFFATLDTFLARKHAENPDLFEYSRLADIPADELYNVDEFGSNTNEKRGKVLAVKDLERYFSFADGGARSQRTYTTTEGDNGQGFHVSVMECTRADGKFSTSKKARLV